VEYEKDMFCFCYSYLLSAAIDSIGGMLRVGRNIGPNITARQRLGKQRVKPLVAKRAGVPMVQSKCSCR
jgi:hypothetical protein